MRSGAGFRGAVLGSLLGLLAAGGAVAAPAASATPRLAYVSPPTLPYSALWAIDADGTHRLKLLGGFHVIGAPVWSPDGARLAVPTCRKDTGSCPGGAVWVLDADGNDRRQLVPSYYNVLAWSPEGTKLLLARGDGALAIVDLHGHLRRIASDADGGTWSPDGNQILYTRNVSSTENLSVFDVATGSVREPTRAGSDGNAAWSPDGRFIAYIAVAGVDRVSVRRADGSHLHVFNWSTDDDATPRWVSPSLVAYEQTPTGLNGSTGATSLRTVDIRTRSTRTVVPNGVVDEDWSPLRREFVIARGPSSPSDAPKDVWVVNEDGTGLRRLTSTGNADRPVWSPDGTAIAVTTLGYDYVWTLILGKRKPRTVAIGYGWFAAWQPTR